MGKLSVAEMQELFEGQYQPFEIKNVKCRWAHVQKPDDRFGEPVYKIDLILSEDQADEMRDIGFNVRTKEGEHFITAKMKAKTPNGDERKPPTLVYDDGTEVEEYIGNGSTVTVSCSAKYVTVAGKTFLPLYFNKVTVHDLVVFQPKGQGTGPNAQMISF